MNIDRIHLGKTYITRTMPWGLNLKHGHRLLCADGVIRAARLAESPDTFFSTPASIRIKGRTITGYMSVEGIDQLSTCDRSQTVFAFRPHVGQDAPYWPSYDTEPGDSNHETHTDH